MGLINKTLNATRAELPFILIATHLILPNPRGISITGHEPTYVAFLYLGHEVSLG